MLLDELAERLVADAPALLCELIADRAGREFAVREEFNDPVELSILLEVALAIRPLDHPAT